MFSPHLTLVGVVHHDPTLPDRLWQLLEERRPGGVSLELSTYSLRFRKDHGERLLERLAASAEAVGAEASGSGAVRAIRRQLELPYEYEVLSAWARRRGVACELVDLSRVAEDYLMHMEELTGRENIEKLIDAGGREPEDEIDKQRRVAARLVKGSKPLEHNLWPVPLDPDTNEREAFMERKIRRSLEGSRAPSSWMHVGGWEHLLWVDGRSSLYVRLRNMTPERLIV